MAPAGINTRWVCLIIGLWWHVVTTGAAQNEYDYVIIGALTHGFIISGTPNAHSLTRSLDRSIARSLALSPGAGIAGAGAAATLKKAGKSVVVLEARDRVGGRTTSKEVDGYIVNLGATWIHGQKDNPLVSLAKRAKVELSREISQYVSSNSDRQSRQPCAPTLTRAWLSR